MGREGLQIYLEAHKEKKTGINEDKRSWWLFLAYNEYWTSLIIVKVSNYKSMASFSAPSMDVKSP